jgi:transcriptional regulator with XRE-family HTH domain
MKHLRQAIELGHVKKIDLHRRTGIGRPSIDGYIGGAVPDLVALDKIADALNCDPRELIKPDNAPPILEHTLKDCMDAIATALATSVGFTPPQIDKASTREQVRLSESLEDQLAKIPEFLSSEHPSVSIEILEKLSDPMVQELILLFSALDDLRKLGALGMLRDACDVDEATPVKGALKKSS